MFVAAILMIWISSLQLGYKSFMKQKEEIFCLVLLLFAYETRNIALICSQDVQHLVWYHERFF